MRLRMVVAVSLAGVFVAVPANGADIAPLPSLTVTANPGFTGSQTYTALPQSSDVTVTVPAALAPYVSSVRAGAADCGSSGSRSWVCSFIYAQTPVKISYSASTFTPHTPVTYTVDLSWTNALPSSVEYGTTFHTSGTVTVLGVAPVLKSDLAIASFTVAAAEAHTSAGTVSEYDITIVNHGPDAGGYDLQMSGLPAGWSVSGSACAPGGDLSCQGHLGVNATAHYRLTLLGAASAQHVTLTAFASGVNEDPHAANNTATLTPATARPPTGAPSPRPATSSAVAPNPGATSTRVPAAGSTAPTSTVPNAPATARTSGPDDGITPAATEPSPAATRTALAASKQHGLATPITLTLAAIVVLLFGAAAWRLFRVRRTGSS